MILRERAYLGSSLAEDIEKVSGGEVAPHPIVLANIISKYILSFVLRESPKKKYIYEEYREKNREIIEELRSREITESMIHGVKYQLRMAYDIPATIEIMADIIETIEHSRREIGGDFRGLDLGSGSGILMLAQYIGARRLGKKDIHIYGIEKNPLAESLSNQVFQSMNLGEVRLGDTQVEGNYPSAMPHFISNENLPTNGIPFDCVEFPKNALPPGFSEGNGAFEPFLQNNLLLRDLYGQGVFHEAGFFPHALSWGNIFDEVESKVFTVQEAYGRKIMDIICRGKEPSKYIYPVQIETGYGKKELSSVGGMIPPDIFLPGGRHFRRWATTSQEAQTSIHALQRAKLLTRKAS